MNGLSFKIFSLGLALTLWFSTGHATQTTVNNNPGGEPSLINNTASFTSVMNHIYGAGNYTRIDDGLDQLWTSQNGQVATEAKFAANSQTLGYFSGNSGNTLNTLFSVGGNGYTVTGSKTGLNQTVFRWGLKTDGQQGTQTLSSLPTDNIKDVAGSMDHMVTFIISGNKGSGFGNNPLGSYVIAFEDLINNSKLGFSSDRDFQDAVFQVKGAHPVGVPEPGTYLILGASLLMAAFARSRKKAFQESKIS